MTLLKWEWQAFLFKLVSTQSGAIISLVRSRNSDPWAWAEVLLFGAFVALGVDTAKWFVDSAREAKKAKEKTKDSKTEQS